MAAIASFGVSMQQFAQQAAEPADATAAFGSLFWLVIVLDVICTLIALYYLWRIWFRERRSEGT